jgi:hypothetical protein
MVENTKVTLTKAQIADINAAIKAHNELAELADVVEGHIVDFCAKMAVAIKAQVWSRMLDAETGKQTFPSLRAWVKSVLGDASMLSRVARDGIIRALAEGGMKPATIVDVMKVSQATVSRAITGDSTPKSDDAKRKDVVARAKSVLSKGVPENAVKFTARELLALRGAIKEATTALDAAAAAKVEQAKKDHPANGKETLAKTLERLARLEAEAEAAAAAS